MASSSPPPQTQLALTPPPPHPRRLPPPCWSHDETAALIDAYRDKWYSLRRGNLRANHWQEVADAVAAACPLPAAKTPVQCRHKMEKLRKRYRNDLTRATATAAAARRPGLPISSSWAHFNRMHAMEKGTSPNSTPIEEDDDVADDVADDEDEELYQSIRRGRPDNGYGSNSKPGFKFKIPSNSPNFSPNPNFVNNGFKEKFAKFETNPSIAGATRIVGNGYKERISSFGPDLSRSFGNGGGERLGKRREREGEAVGEVAAALRALGEGFLRTERMKMEMAREVEAMRMEMEMKRTEMIIESQQRIVEAFVSAISENKK